MMFIQCISCKHYLKSDTCKAYPNGIPTRFLYDTDHEEVEPDQEGKFVFEEAANIRPSSAEPSARDVRTE